MNIFARIWMQAPINPAKYPNIPTAEERERASRTAESIIDDKANANTDNTNNAADNSSARATNKTSTIKNDDDSNTVEINPEDFEVKSETPISKTATEEAGEAAMGANSSVATPNVTGVDFGFFVKKEDEKVTPDPGFFKPVTPDSYMSYDQVQQGFRPNTVHHQNPVQNPQSGNQAMQQPMNQTPNVETPKQPIVGKGRHKVDNPTKPKPDVKKSEPEKVDVDLDLMVKPDMKEPTVRKVPDMVQELPKAEPAPTPESKFDNSAIIAQYKYLGDIERVARENGAQVKFDMRPGSNGKPSGLITCLTFTENDVNRPSPYKSFTIDTGKIIDRRAKILIGDPTAMAYEDMQMYLVLVSSKDADARSKNKNNVFNEKLFKDIFTGGYKNLEQSRMYTKELLELNKYVALITMPTNNMNSETRKAVRDRLLAAAREGVFKKALERDPKSRFRFDSYDKKTMEFRLTTAGTPYRFCGPCMATKTITLNFKADGMAVLSEE